MPDESGSLDPTKLLPGSSGGRPGRYTPWPPFQALLAVPAILGIGIIVGFTLVPALLGQTGGNDRAPLSGSTFLLSLLAMQCVIAVATLAVAGRFGNDPWRVLALGPPPSGRAAYLAGIGAMLALLIAANLVLIFGLGHDPLTDLREMATSIRGDGWLLALLVLGIGAPVSEELLIRGFLLPALKDSPLGFWGAAGLSTAIWTLLHIGSSIPGLAEIFLIGMLFSWLMRLTGSLRVPLACHVINNVMLVLAVRFLPLPL
jgi:uncharacterized protein